MGMVKSEEVGMVKSEEVGMVKSEEVGMAHRCINWGDKTST